MAKIAKHLDKLGFLDIQIRYPLRDLLMDVFDKSPLVRDVSMSRHIPVRYCGSEEWIIELLIQVIWVDVDVWIEPIKLEIRMNEAGEILYKSCESKSNDERLRFYELASFSSLWMQQHSDDCSV